MRMKMKFAKRKCGAQSLVELAAGLMVFVPIILVMIDCAVIMIGVSTNEAACRDAARAASCGPPSALISGAQRSVGPSGSPYKRALSVVKNVYAAGGLVSISDNLNVKETLSDPTPQAPQGGPVIGEVSVETTAEVAPPFLVRIFVPNGTYQFKSTQNYPYTYVVPSS